MQFCVSDLAERAIAYGIPGVIVDGTDPCQVYDATHEACERARRGEGPTLIEAKMMRMKGHAIHDAAQYVPAKLFEYWRARDPIARLENYLSQREKVADRGEDDQKLITGWSASWKPIAKPRSRHPCPIRKRTTPTRAYTATIRVTRSGRSTGRSRRSCGRRAHPRKLKKPQCI